MLVTTWNKQCMRIHPDVGLTTTFLQLVLRSDAWPTDCQLNLSAYWTTYRRFYLTWENVMLVHKLPLVKTLIGVLPVWEPRGKCLSLNANQLIVIKPVVWAGSITHTEKKSSFISSTITTDASFPFSAVPSKLVEGNTLSFPFPWNATGNVMFPQ